MQMSLLPEGYKENSYKPNVRFIRVRGRVIPIVQGKKSHKAADNINARLGEMKAEVMASTSSGRSFSTKADGSTKNIAASSNYPDFYRSMKFRNKTDFMKALYGKSNKSDDLVKEAHDNLSTGYETSYGGRVAPDLNYKVDTKQVYDNRGVVFRRFNGKVVPIRTKKVKEPPMPKNLDNYDDVPF